MKKKRVIVGIFLDGQVMLHTDQTMDFASEDLKRRFKINDLGQIAFYV